MNHGKCIISGYVAGQKFRPSNWSERLCEAGATFDPIKRVMRYSEHLYARECDNYGCSIYVNFDALDAGLARHVTQFIDSNGLEVIPLRTLRLHAVAKRVTQPARYIRRNKAA